MSKILIVTGTCLLIAGVFWHVFERLGFGRLPGDIHIKGESYSLHLPIMSSVIISLLISLLVYLVQRFRN